MRAVRGSSTSKTHQSADRKRGEAQGDQQRLSKRQREAYDIVVRSLRERGIPPSRPELSRALKRTGTAGADHFLNALARKGWIELLPDTQRGIRLISAGELPVISDTEPDGGTDADHPHVLDRVPGTLADQVHPRPDYFVECHTDSLRGLGVRTGDLLAIRTATDAENGWIIAARRSRGSKLRFGRFERIDERHAELRAVTEGETAIRLDTTKQGWSIAGLVVGAIKVRSFDMQQGGEDEQDA